MRIASTLLFGLLLALPALAQRIEISPAEVVAGAPVRIVLKDFVRNGEVTVVAERPVRGFIPGSAPVRYRAEASFRTTHAGTLDLATARPLRGSYDLADLTGLFWSMAPVDEPLPEDWPAEEVRLRVRQDDAIVAHASLLLRNADPGVQIEPVDADLPGALLARPADRVRRPALIVLGGSEGGDSFARSMAPRLASLGYAVLGLPYYAPAYLGRDDLADLPQPFVDIPVDRLQVARDWLATRADIDADRIGLYGVSKGAEFALLAATRFDWVVAVAAIVPTDVVWEGWGLEGMQPGTRASFSWQGQALPFVPYLGLQAEFMAMGSGAAILRRAHDHGRAAHPDRAVAARIPVERFRGALLVAGGMQDRVWGSGPMAQAIAERRAAAGLDTVNLVFFDAGHALSGHGWSPTTQLDVGMAMGGSARGTAHAQARTWQATRTLFDRVLQPPAPPAVP